MAAIRMIGPHDDHDAFYIMTNSNDTNWNNGCHPYDRPA